MNWQKAKLQLMLQQKTQLMEQTELKMTLLQVKFLSLKSKITPS